MKQKFEVWDKKHLQFDDSIYIYLDQDGDIYLIEERNKSMMSYMHREEVSDRYELIFWTGLTDRNGKEIYEGDVGEGEHATYLIQWNAEKAQYRAKIIKTKSVLSKHCSFPLWQYVEDDGKCRFEIIGNIYENSDLINS